MLNLFLSPRRKYIRVTLHEAETIVKHTRSVFGVETKVILFGSRVDDIQKGRDIDLYIETEDSSSRLLEKKLEFIYLLEEVFGEQKNDVVFKRDNLRAIDQQALNKGITSDILTIKLTKYLNECDRHIQRIEEAFEDMQGIIPLSVERYTTLTKDEVRNIDQFLFRFSKLQDTMGDKIFNRLLKN